MDWLATCLFAACFCCVVADLRKKSMHRVNWQGRVIEANESNDTYGLLENVKNEEDGRMKDRAVESQQRGTNASRAASEGQLTNKHETADLAHVKSDLAQLLVTEREIEKARGSNALREALGTTSLISLEEVREDAERPASAVQSSASNIPESSVHVLSVRKSKWGPQLEEFGANSQSLGTPLATGGNAGVWCVTAPGSRGACPPKCIPSIERNPACLVLRKSSFTRSIEVIQRTIDLQNFLADKGLAPKIKNAWKVDPDDWQNQTAKNGRHKADIWVVMAPALGQSLKAIVIDKGLARKENSTYVFADKEAIARKLDKECAAVLRAVEQLHRLQILHRDMHWNNIFIDQNQGKATFIDLDDSSRIGMEMTIEMASRDMPFKGGFCIKEAEDYLRKYANERPQTQQR